MNTKRIGHYNCLTIFLFITDKAFVQYDKLNNVMDLVETEVPEEFRGKGVAQKLAKVNTV